MLMCKASVDAAAEAVHAYLMAALTTEDGQQIHCAGEGPVAIMEDKLKRHYKMKHALCLSNATMGIMAIGLSFGLRRGEFITTPYTYGGTLAGWQLLGNRPIFADIDPHTLTLDCEAAARQITPKTRAILAADIYGIPSDQESLRRLADEHGIWYIADAAQSLGATRDGLPSSCLADALIVSFTAGKTIFAGEGGAVLTNNTQLYEKLLWFTQHPIRQRRELGLFLDNEFALNARANPLAIALAASVFEGSLERLARHQQECFRLIEGLNRIGLTEKIHFKEQKIVPTFSRLSAVWLQQAREADLIREMSSLGHQIIIEPAPVRLVYQQSSFLAQYSRRVSKAVACPQAEHQARWRFCIRNSNRFQSN